MNLFFVLILLIASVCNGADYYETNIKGNKAVIYTLKDGNGKFDPSLKMSKWNDEEYLRFTFKGSSKFTSDEKTLDNKVRVSNEDTTLEYYTEEDSMKIIVIFNKKPKKNTYSFEIENWENFNFYYQGELQPEDIAMGAHRPDNVVGSYAVYHKTKRNHITGQTNYETGKAFHIYRPKFVDANGKEAWANLNIKEGIYTVTIPQKFLDSAVYPIYANDTFGDNAIGASSGNFENYVIGAYATAGSAGTGTSMSAYVQSTGDDPIHELGCYLYDDTNTKTTNGETERKNSSTTAGWIDFNFNSAPTIAAQQYLLCIWGGSGQYDVKIWFDDEDLGDAEYDYDSGQWNWPTGGFSDSDNVYSIYVTYTPSGGGETPAQWSTQLIVP